MRHHLGAAECIVPTVLRCACSRAQEWMKVQLGQAVRSQVNEMLSGSGNSSHAGGSKSGNRETGKAQGAEAMSHAEDGGDDGDSYHQDGVDGYDEYVYD